MFSENIFLLVKTGLMRGKRVNNNIIERNSVLKDAKKGDNNVGVVFTDCSLTVSMF